MNNKTLLASLVVVLVILMGVVVYSYNQYIVLSDILHGLESNYNNLQTELNDLEITYNNLRAESDSFTDFGGAKIKLPIDSEHEAILVAQNLDEYKDFYINERLSQVRESSDLFFGVSVSEIDGKSVYRVVVEVNAPSGRELILDIDAETGNLISPMS